MANIITKTLGSNPKNAVLTNAELDNNFINLNEELITKINNDAVEYPSSYLPLNRTPTGINKLFIYDTSKDSDGGAWTDKCQNTSWYNEPLSGNWLGIHSTEIMARLYNSTVGSDIAVNGSFTTDTNWNKDAGVTINNGTAIFNNPSYNTGLAAMDLLSRTLPVERAQQKLNRPQVEPILEDDIVTNQDEIDTDIQERSIAQEIVDNAAEDVLELIALRNQK